MTEVYFILLSIGFLLGVGVSFGALATRIWWINRGLNENAKWPMFGYGRIK